MILSLTDKYIDSCRASHKRPGTGRPHRQDDCTDL